MQIAVCITAKTSSPLKKNHCCGIQSTLLRPKSVLYGRNPNKDTNRQDAVPQLVSTEMESITRKMANNPEVRLGLTPKLELLQANVNGSRHALAAAEAHVICLTQSQ